MVGSNIWDGEELYRIVAKTEVTAEGFQLTYEDQWWNKSVTLTRQGAGLGGIFIGESWCNKAYIEKNFSHLDTYKGTQDNGAEYWILEAGTDGWSFSIQLEFDKEGKVSELRFHCNEHMMN
jgi:hypothetical protein